MFSEMTFNVCDNIFSITLIKISTMSLVRTVLVDYPSIFIVQYRIQSNQNIPRSRRWLNNTSS